MPELSTHDRAIPLLVKHSEALHKILIGAAVLGPADVLVYGQELLKVEHFCLHVWVRTSSPQRKGRLSIMSSPHNPVNMGGVYTQPTFGLGFPKDVHDLRLGGILAQSPDQVTTLAISDFHLVSGGPVKQLESVFEVCEETLRLFLVFIFALGSSIFFKKRSFKFSILYLVYILCMLKCASLRGRKMQSKATSKRPWDCCIQKYV